MVAGIFLITVGIILLIIGRAWADKMANRFRTLGSDMDPAYFKIATSVLGLGAIIFGLVKLTAALSPAR